MVNTMNKKLYLAFKNKLTLSESNIKAARDIATGVMVVEYLDSFGKRQNVIVYMDSSTGELYIREEPKRDVKLSVTMEEAAMIYRERAKLYTKPKDTECLWCNKIIHMNFNNSIIEYHYCPVCGTRLKV